ncbi:hypothetical protein [Sphaerisporangium album]
MPISDYIDGLKVSCDPEDVWGFVQSREAWRMNTPWEVDTEAGFLRRLGKSMRELGSTANTDGCPDIWEMENGDIAVVGRDVTASYAGRLPDGLTIRADERLVMIPRQLLTAAKPDIPNA